MNDDDLEWARQPFSAGEKALIVFGILALTLASLCAL